MLEPTSSDKRVARSAQSVRALVRLLEEFVRSPSELLLDQSDFLTALSSQGALASYSDTERDISSSSINTQKRIANQILDGGYEYLDRLRTAAVRAVNEYNERQRHSNKITKVGLGKRVEELQANIATLGEDLLLLTMLFEKSMSQGREYARTSKNPAVITLCEREQQVLRDMLSLRRVASSSAKNPIPS